MKRLNVYIAKLKYFILKRRIYYIIKEHPKGITIFKVAESCPHNTNLKDISDCINELFQEGRIKHDDYILFLN